MLEAVIAGIIILGFLAVITQSYISAPKDDPAGQAYQSLKSLDQQGILRPYAQAGDWGSINDNVNIYSRNHTVQICDSSRCWGQKPEAPDVWVGSYIISGYQDYHPYTVRLYLW